MAGKGVTRFKSFPGMVRRPQFFLGAAREGAGSGRLRRRLTDQRLEGLGPGIPGYESGQPRINGDVSRSLRFRFQEDVLDLNPKAVVILIGNNDLAAMGSAGDAASNITDMVAMALKKNPNLPIVLCTIPPSADPMAAIKPAEREALNAKIRQLTEGRKNIVVCDLFAALVDAKGSPKAEYFTADKLHLGRAGYDKWAELLLPVFQQLDGAKRQ